MLGAQMAMADFLCWRHEGMAAGCGLWLAVRGRGRAVLEQQHWEEWHTCHVFVHFFFSLPIEVVSKRRRQIYF